MNSSHFNQQLDDALEAAKAKLHEKYAHTDPDYEEELQVQASEKDRKFRKRVAKTARLIAIATKYDYQADVEPSIKWALECAETIEKTLEKYLKE